MTKNQALQRCINVFESCETVPQVITAFRYFQLVERKGMLTPEAENYLRHGVFPTIRNELADRKGEEIALSEAD